MDDMAEHVKSTSEAQSPGLETLYPVPQPKYLKEAKSRLMTKHSSDQVF